MEQAKNELKAAIKATAASRTTIAGEIAMANILFQQKRFAEAHRFYCQVMPAHASFELLHVTFCRKEHPPSSEPNGLQRSQPYQ